LLGQADNHAVRGAVGFGGEDEYGHRSVVRDCFPAIVLGWPLVAVLVPDRRPFLFADRRSRGIGDYVDGDLSNRAVSKGGWRDWNADFDEPTQ